MTSVLLVGPTVEPISLADAKTYLRVSGTEDDSLIETLIAAARVHVETLTRRALITQDWRKILDCWPEKRQVELPLGPIQSLVAVRTFDDDGTPTELPLTQFVPETNSAPAKVLLPKQAPNTQLRAIASIEIDYRVGYGATADAVPQDLRQSLLSLIGHWYQNREAVLMAGSGAIVPHGFDALISNYRVPNL